MSTLFWSGEIRFAGMSMSIGMAGERETGKVYVTYGFGGPASLVEGTFSEYSKHAVLAAGLLAFFSAKIALNGGYSEVEISKLFDHNSPDLVIEGHLIWFGGSASLDNHTYTVSLGYGISLGYQVKVDSGFEIPRATKEELILAYLGNPLTSKLTQDVMSIMRFLNLDKCFLSGTPILMAGGVEKPVEAVEVGDVVMAFDPGREGGRGALAGRRVTRTFRNTTRHVVEVAGVRCTPGHVFLTGETDASGRGVFRTIGRILKADGTIVDQDGRVLRARTGAVVDGPDDRIVRVVYRDPASGVTVSARVRAGIPCLWRTGEAGPEVTTLAERLKHAGFRVLPEGGLQEPDGTVHSGCDWPVGATPFDHPAQAAWIVEDADGRAYRPLGLADLPDEDDRSTQWISAGPGSPHAAAASH